MERTKSQRSGLRKGFAEDLAASFCSSVRLVPAGRERTHRIPSEMTTAMMMDHPMRVVRGPKRRRRTAKIGERAADAMFADPKLKLLAIYLMVLSSRSSQDAIGKAAAFQEPLIHIAYTWRKQNAAGYSVQQTLRHDDLKSLCESELRFWS